MEVTFFDGRILRGVVGKIDRGLESVIKRTGYINKKYNKLVYSELRSMARSAIDTFYNDKHFQPGRYRRKHDLYNAFKIIAEDDMWDILLGSEFMKKNHHQSNEIIYQNSLVVGVHGGSLRDDDDADGYYWRTPHPHYTEWYPDPAPYGPPHIEQDILDRATGIISHFKDERQKEFNEYAHNILSDIKSSLRRLF